MKPFALTQHEESQQELRELQAAEVSQASGGRIQWDYPWDPGMGPTAGDRGPVIDTY